jgi:predicted RNase H-like HicB family nuclease
VRCGIIESSSITSLSDLLNQQGRDIDKKFTAVFEQEGEWWIGYVEDLPGANTQGQTLEVRENLKEAVQLITEAKRELARRKLKARKSRRQRWLM